MPITNQNELQSNISVRQWQVIVHFLADLLFLIGTLIYFIFPVTISALVFFIPCQQPFLGSLFLPPSSCKAPSSLERVSLAALEFVAMHYMGMTGSVFVVGVTFSGMIYLWLETSNLPRKNSQRYRELHVFEKLFNSCVQGRIFPLIVTSCPVVEILGGFACIRLRESMNLLQLVFIMMETFSLIVFSLISFTAAGKIYTGSVTWMRGCKAGEGNRVNRKVLASLTPLRVRFGQNFVDGLTPLILQQFCTIKMADLLLLF